ncbi:LacI family DNA-binding transcriptional regulator [Thalassococcus sp. S3]|uniref:LacI family DNA-binding transcriptional regulator n=1 Tax=Thalassococcus sp. S3 TaxID=2017482 RepID=UPI0010247774|nr:LacI family DNA-binding transcriptional regulator [Thalassococcus sp. S3]QBF34288.1 LacI family transcriptional regulator [Thalassococcus sp. S3]
MSASSKVRLAEVAKLAQVSEITVSRVVRGAANVSPDTVRRVEEALEQTGYVRNRLAGSFGGRTSNQIAVILPSLSNIVFPDVLYGLEERLETAGYHPILGVSNYDTAREARLIAGLLEWQPAGLVIATTDLSPKARTLLTRAPCPVVEIMEIDADPVDMAVGLSQVQAGKSMAYYLLGRGYDSFGYIGHDLTRDRRAVARRDGFRAALREAGLDFETSLEEAAPTSVALGRKLTARMLDAGAPRLIYYSNDDMAMGGQFEALARGLSMPDTLALAGFNGLDLGQAAPIPLTTVESRRGEIGAMAADQILKRLAGEQTARSVDIGFKLISGASA